MAHGRAFAAVLLAATTLTAPALETTQATAAQCDNYSADYFRHVGSRVSVNAHGCTVHLRNGAAANHSFAMIYSGLPAR